MHHELKAFDKATGSALVRFWTDSFPAGLTYNVDIPIVDDAYLTGQALADHIMAFAPHGQIERMVAAASVSSTAIEALVVPAAPVPAKTAEELAEEARAEAKKRRAAYVADIKVQTSVGHWFDGDETSQNRMARAIIALNAQPQDPVPTVTWVLADNKAIQVTAAELTEALTKAGAAQAAVWVV
jgi:hypothetical protein